MTITKYLHSCLVLEEGGKRLMVDPGIFCFIEEKLKPEDIGPVDVIVLTHKHPDHFYPQALKKITALGSATVITHAEIGALLDAEGLAWEEMKEGESRVVAGFHLRACGAPHERLPIPCPHNLGFVINDTILLPGDSYSVRGVEQCDVLALPVAGPWSRLADGVDFAKKLKPRVVIPIHDAIIKDFFIERIYDMCRTPFGEAGIEFHPLAPGESYDIKAPA